MLVPPLVHDVARERGQTQHERARGDPDGHEMLAERREAEHRGAKPAAGESETEPVERRRLLPRGGNEAQPEDHAERADRQIDEKDVAPVEVRRNEAAEGRPDHRPDERRDRDPRQRLHDLGLRHGPQQHETADRNHHRAADALHETAGHERAQRVAERTSDRAGEEHGDRRDERRTRAETVGHPTADGDEDREREQIRGQCELQGDRVSREIGRDRGQRCREHGRVHVLDEQRASDDQGQETGGFHGRMCDERRATRSARPASGRGRAVNRPRSVP